MKNPQVAAVALCAPSQSFTAANSSGTTPNGNFTPFMSSPTRTASGSLKGVSTSKSSCWYALLRNRLRFGVLISAAILFTDTCLRFSWVLRFYDKLFPSHDSFVLCTQFLEVLRRALWNLLRVEWENMKQTGQHLAPKSPSSIAMVPISSAAVSVPPNPSSDDSSSSLTQRGSGAKITMEKNAAE